uniref:non-specific serine/threonine protein kinase n=1 Tax=Periophthalmus magnuspinnatus TaxID=409849 RepID=A0A3B4BMT7_9GOBI
MASPVVERCAYSPVPERRRAAGRRPERREKNQENKENTGDRDAETFLVPSLQTPVSSKKSGRPNKNVLTTPNDNVSTKTSTSPRVLCCSLLCPRSRSLDMAGSGDSGKKRKAGKVFGSLERGLDKVITMLTPSKRRGPRDAPRKIKVQYNVTLTNQTNPDQVLNQILSALPEKNVDFTQKGYTLKCQTWGDFGKVTMAFELEVCFLQKLDVVGVRRQRLKGDAWVYKHLVEDILSTSSI